MRSTCWTMSFLSQFSIDVEIEGHERYKEDVKEARYQVLTARAHIPGIYGAYAPDHEEHC